jgi:carboxyl-terminal processing protease
MKLKRTVVGPALVAGVAFVSGGWLLQRGVAEQVGLFESARVFDEVVRAISSRYVDEHPSADLYRMAIDGMLRELGDPHTTFMTAEEYNNLRVQTTGEYGGLGVEIDQRDGWITIVAPLPDSPAERVGLQSGDRIIEVEGRSTQGWSTQDAVNVLRGPKGQAVSIRIARPGVDEPLPFNIVRDEIQVHAVRAAYLMEDGVGLIFLSVFSEAATQDLVKAVEDLKAQGMTRLILDLRGNPGGLLDQGIAVSDLFLRRGASISETRSRDPRETRTFRAATGEQFPDIPIAVLVDRFSASASEIVAGALQDNDRALVVGETSFGKGSVQTLQPLSGGNYLKLTTGRWYTPAGRTIQKPHATEGDPFAVLEDEPLGPDGEPVAPTDTVTREEYRTFGGRVIYGGGGIVPDVQIARDTVTLAERPYRTATMRSPEFRSVLFRYAMDHARRNPGLRADFEVTPAMRQEFFTRLRGADVEVAREEFEAARRLVDADLGFEIALHKFGRGVARQRADQESSAVRAATELLRGATSQQALFQRAQALSAANVSVRTP